MSRVLEVAPAYAWQSSRTYKPTHIISAHFILTYVHPERKFPVGHQASTLNFGVLLR
jgi:hypothetical protein